jgi:hypothetical protein
VADETEVALGGLKYVYHLMKLINLELRITISCILMEVSLMVVATQD